MERKFMDYLRKYCIKHNIPVAEALRHKLIKEVCVYYAESVEGKIDERDR